ncbi:MAG: hypothetical protein LC105_04300 [Chitinophagales bacterium]|nr:hypothetical protein [Chitinophagales bacterium]
MKKLITDNAGGFPFVLDDLRWIESGNQEIFKALITPYLPYSDISNAIIVSGLKVESLFGYLMGCEEGYVYWGGEVFYCPGFDFGTFPNAEYWGGRMCMRVKENFDESEAGNKVFQIGGEPVPVYTNRTVELIYVAGGLPLPPNTEWLPSLSVTDAIYENMRQRAGAILDRGILNISLGKNADGSVSINNNYGSEICVFASVEIVSGGSSEGDRNDVTLTFAKNTNSVTFWLHNFEARPITVNVHYMFMRR